MNQQDAWGALSGPTDPAMGALFAQAPAQPDPEVQRLLDANRFQNLLEYHLRSKGAPTFPPLRIRPSSAQPNTQVAGAVVPLQHFTL
jgi:hypothetical protein